MKKCEVIVIKTVQYGGKVYGPDPGKTVFFPESVAIEIIDKGLGKPVVPVAVKPAAPEPVVVNPEAGKAESFTMEDLVKAVGKAVEDGNVIGSGVPSVEALEDILGCQVSAEERDEAYDIWKQTTGK